MVIDYNALAQQNGAISSTPAGGAPINYNALAQQNGALPAAPAPAAPKPDLLTKAANVATSLFPGTKTIGNSLGTAAVGLGQLAGIVPGGMKGFAQTAATAPTVPQLAGAYTAAGATALSPEAGGIAANAGIGAAIAGGSKLADGGTAGQAAESALGGAALYGGTATLGKAVAAIAPKLPTRIVQKALGGATPETADYAMSNTKLGSISSILADSKTATQSGANQIQAALEHPDNAGKIVEGNNITAKVQSALPGTTISNQKLTQKVSALVPNHSNLVDKLFNGDGLTLPEANTLRQNLDQAVKSVYINGQKVDAPAVSANKALGAEVAGAIRNDVKGQAPETKPMFDKLSQEITLRNALAKVSGKLDKGKAIGLYDIMSGLGGLAAGGPVGALGAYATEKALRSPAVNIAAAKGIAKAAPVIGRAATVGAKAAGPSILGDLNQ